MDLDDPTKPEFVSVMSYGKFAKRVRRGRRFVWGREVQAFLDTVLATRKDRDRIIQKDTILYRAQQGVDDESYVDEDGNELRALSAFGSERMKPLEDRAKEGRANPAGIPVLYLASAEQTAISEVRPWIGMGISLAQFKIVRDLRALDLSLGHDQLPIGDLTLQELGGEKTPDAQKKEKAVWIEIDNAFSRLVTPSDDHDIAYYAPTQILAELFQDAGYDAIVYRSQFGEMGFNIAFFNVEDAEPITAVLCRVTKINIEFDEIGDRWFSKEHFGSKKKKSD